MSSHHRILIGIGLMLYLCPSASAVWTRSRSIEWNTSISTGIVIAEVSKATPAKSENKNYLFQDIEFNFKQILKGAPTPGLTLEQSYDRDENTPPHAFYTGRLRVGDRVLLFIATEHDEQEPSIIDWFNLTRPDKPLTAGAAYDNEGRHLDTERKIVDLVAARVAAEKPGQKPRRGLLMDLPHYNGDMHWDFVRTADAEYKSVLLEKLRTTEYPDEKVGIIYNLASYPDADVVKLLRSFLTDPTTQEVVRTTNDKTETRTMFKLRQAAYFALSVMGERVEPPTGFDRDYNVLLFSTGFEDSSYFPVGDWKRVKFEDEAEP